MGTALPSDLGGYKYTAFGKLLPADAGTPAPELPDYQTGDAVAFEQPLRWQGRWYSELGGGTYDVRARQWSPGLGAFLSADEMGFLTPTGTLWSWPGQGPTMRSDPSGRWGILGGFEGSAQFTAVFSAFASGFWGFGSSGSAIVKGIGTGIGFPPAAGAGPFVGFFTGDAKEYAGASTLYLGGGEGLGIQGGIIMGNGGHWGLQLWGGAVAGSPVWFGISSIGSKTSCTFKK